MEGVSIFSALALIFFPLPQGHCYSTDSCYVKQNWTQNAVKQLSIYEL